MTTITINKIFPLVVFLLYSNCMWSVKYKQLLRANNKNTHYSFGFLMNKTIELSIKNDIAMLSTRNAFMLGKNRFIRI